MAPEAGRSPGKEKHVYRKTGDLMYDENNLDETIAYCKTHNAIFRDRPDAEIFDEVFKRVAQKTSGLATANLDEHAGIMDSALNAFFVVDSYDSRLKVPIEVGVERGTHVVNFFVRLGRKPVPSTDD